MKPYQTFFLLPAVCLAGAAAAQAQTSFSLSPVQLNLVVAPGKTGGGLLTIGNDSFNAVRIQAEAETWAIASIGSNTIPAEGADRFTCRNWIRVAEPEFLLNPGERRKVTATISVPPTAEPGQYLAAVSFRASAGEADRDRSGVSIQGRLIAIFFVTVGDPRAEGSVLDLTVEKTAGRPVVTIRVKNSGRVFLNLTGEMEIRNARGRKIATVDVPEEIVPPLSEGLVPVAIDKEIPPGTYQVGCVLNLPSRKTLEFKKSIEIR